MLINHLRNKVEASFCGGVGIVGFDELETREKIILVVVPSIRTKILIHHFLFMLHN